jgi:hypothetical protein
LPVIISRACQLLCRVAAALACFLPALAAAQIGHVVSVQGTALVERAGQPGRILGAGERLEQKDVINVAQGSSAVLEFRDKTRITLRPKTVFRVDSYSDSAPVGMAFGLTKGGFRAVTGEVGKKDPSSVTFRAESVVLGIRGTEFDARLCEDDCVSQESGASGQRALARAPARVIEMNGSVSAAKSGTPGRSIVPGAVIHEGESVSTGPDSQAVIAFRDGARITLPQSSELAIARFDYDESAPGKGQAHVKLVSGGAHVRTGELARIGPDAFVFETAAGTVRTKAGGSFTVGGRTASGRRPPAQPSAELMLKSLLAHAWTEDLAQSGSAGFPAATGHGIVRTRAPGFDVAAAGDPALNLPSDDVLVIHTSDGSVIIQTATERIELPKSGTLAVAIIDGKVTFLPAPPPYFAGIETFLPDNVKADPATFDQAPPLEKGLYIWVREGAVSLGLGKEDKPRELKAGEAAHIGGAGIRVLDFVPNVLRFDLAVRSNLPAAGPVLRFFRASDGSITRMCK